jgi:hypothetical protein
VIGGTKEKERGIRRKSRAKMAEKKARKRKEVTESVPGMNIKM